MVVLVAQSSTRRSRSTSGNGVLLFFSFFLFLFLFFLLLLSFLLSPYLEQRTSQQQHWTSKVTVNAFIAGDPLKSGWSFVVAHGPHFWGKSWQQNFPSTAPQKRWVLQTHSNAKSAMCAKYLALRFYLVVVQSQLLASLWTLLFLRCRSFIIGWGKSRALYDFVIFLERSRLQTS